jgi:hypothetical protein
MYTVNKYSILSLFLIFNLSSAYVIFYLVRKLFFNHKKQNDKGILVFKLKLIFKLDTSCIPKPFNVK